MKTTTQIARQLRESHFGASHTGSSLKQNIEGINWIQANTKVKDLNTIAVLVFHINYYIDAVLGVLEGKPLTARDKYSYNMPEIKNEQEWEQLKEKAFNQVEELAKSIEKLPNEKLHEMFVKEAYGTYFRNLTGLIEHSYYHIGQLGIIRKLI